MTLAELLTSTYAWLDAHAPAVLAVCAGVPVAGTALAWLGRGGRTDKDGRLIANLVLGFALATPLLLIVGVAIAHWGFDRGVFEANVLLLLAPIAALGLGFGGVHLVFPLNELASARTARDVGLFVLVLLGVVWLFSQFRGWGVVFFGSIAQLIAFGLLLFWLVRRLYRRAFKGDDG